MLRIPSFLASFRNHNISISDCGFRIIQLRICDCRLRISGASDHRLMWSEAVLTKQSLKQRGFSIRNPQSAIRNREGAALPEVVAETAGIVDLAKCHLQRHSDSH